MKNSYTIGEVIKKLHINKETIRYYEKISLLPNPKKEKNGYRTYSEKDINMIWFILIAKEFGFTLKEIKTLISTIYPEIIGGDVESIGSIINSKINDIDNKISDLGSTKKLLQRINDNILSQNKKCYNDLEKFLKNNA